MNSKANHAFVNQLLFSVLVTFCLGGSVGLGTVWLRHQISVIADNNRRLAQSCAELERRVAETRALVEEEQSNDILRRRNTAWQLGLVPITPAQVVNVTEDPVRRLAVRANRGLYDRAVPYGDVPAGAVANPLRIQVAFRR